MRDAVQDYSELRAIFRCLVATISFGCLLAWCLSGCEQEAPAQTLPPLPPAPAKAKAKALKTPRQIENHPAAKMASPSPSRIPQLASSIGQIRLTRTPFHPPTNCFLVTFIAPPPQANYTNCALYSCDTPRGPWKWRGTFPNDSAVVGMVFTNDRPMQFFRAANIFQNQP